MYEIVDESKKPQRERVLEKLVKVWDKSFNALQIIVIISAFGVAAYLLLVTPHEVDGYSMFPTYDNGELMLANKLTYKFSKPKRGDVIIFKYSPTTDYIKRVIGLPGDTVALHNGELYINGEALDEEYLVDDLYTNEGKFLKDGMSIDVPEGQYFVSGDNRPGSSDSRNFGPIEFSEIKGKVILIFYPFGDARLIIRPDYNIE